MVWSSTLVRERQPVDVPAEAGATARASLRWYPSAFGLASSAVFLLAVFQNFYRLSVAPLLPTEGLYVRMGWLYVNWSSLTPARRAPADTNFEHPPLAKILLGLAQLAAGHPSLTAARAVDAVCVIATAALLAWWIGRLVDRWTGLLAGAALALIPMPIYLDATRFGRAAELDTVAQLFMLASLVTGWFWSQASGRRAWAYAAGTGLCVGLAAASKENGLLGLAGPILLSFFWSRTSWSRLRSWLGQLLLAGVLAAGTFLAPYLLFDDMRGRIGYLLRFQTDHSANGHLVGFAGRVAIHPPWWTNFWFAQHSLGLPLTVALVATAVVALLARRGPLVGWLATSLAGPIVFHCFYAGVTLSYYWTLWAPAVIALSALGIHQLVVWARTYRSAWPGVVAALAVAAAMVGIAVPVAAETTRIATLRPEGAGAVAHIREDRGLHGTIISAGIVGGEISPLIPGTVITPKFPADMSSVDMIVLGQPRCRVLRPREVRALIVANLQTQAIRLIHTDRLVKVYIVDHPLTLPTVALVRAQPFEGLADHC